MPPKTKIKTPETKAPTWFIYLFIAVLLAYTTKVLDPALQIRFIALAIVQLIALFIVYKQLKTSSISVVSLPFFICWAVYWLFSAWGIVVLGNPVGDAWYLWLQIFLAGLLPLLLLFLFSKAESYSIAVVKLFVWVLLIAVAVGAWQFFNAASLGKIDHGTTYKITSLFAHKNIFAEVLALLLPFTFIAMLHENRVLKYFGIVSFIAACVFIAALLSRAVWLSCLFGIAATVIIYLLMNRFSPLSHGFSAIKEVFKYSIIAVFVAIIGFAVFSGNEFRNAVIKQTKDMINPLAYANKDRIAIWEKTYAIWQQKPLMGIGMGQWKIEILKTGNKNLQSEDNITFFQRPHNDYLWIAAEQGVFALVFFLLAFAIILFMTYRLAYFQKNLTQRLFFLFMGFCVWVYLGISMFSFPKERIEHLVIIGFVFSIVIIAYQKQFGTKKLHLPAYSIFVFALLLLSALFIGISRFTSELHLRKAFEARASGNWKLQVVEIDNAHSAVFKIDFVSTPLMWYKGEALFNINRRFEAFECFREAEKVNPYHMHVLNNIGTCYEMEGNHDMAIDYYNKALALTGYFEDALFNLCAVYYNLNDFGKATEILQLIKPETNDRRYQKFSVAIIDNYLRFIANSETNGTSKKIINNIRQNKDWAMLILEKSIANSMPFSNQLYLDIEWIKNDK